MANNRELSQLGSFVEVADSTKLGIGASVGIGTTLPTVQLEVHGDVKTVSGKVGVQTAASVDLQVHGQTQLDDLNILGIATFVSAIDANGGLNISGGNALVASSLKVSDLTDNRVAIAGTDGELEDDSNLTFNGSTLAIGVDLDVDGHTELDDVNVSGASTFTGAADFNGAVDVDGHTELDDVNVSGASTFTGAADFNGDIDVDGHTELDFVRVSAAATFESLVDVNGGLEANSAKIGDLNNNRVVIAGVSGELEDDANFTFNGETVNIDAQLTVSGVSTFGTIQATSFVTGASGSAIGFNSNSITGPAQMFIDPAAVGDNTGSVRIKGDLFVDGTTTQINSTTVEIADFIVGIASTATTDILADGAGIKIGPNNTFLYEHNGGTNSSLKSSENLNVASGKVYQIGETERLSSDTLSVGTGATIHSPDSNVLTLGTNNAERLRITSGGHLGVGDNNPDTRLSVKAASGTDVVGKFTSTDANAWIQFRDNTTTDTAVMVGANGDNLLLRAGSNERLRITSAGLVGIGVTNPSEKLQIAVGTTPEARNLKFGVDSTLGTSEIYSTENGGYNRGLSLGGSDVIFSTNGGGSTTRTERLRITSSGQILSGIATARDNLANNASGVEAQVQIEGSSFTSSTLSIIRNSNDANDGGIILGKTRSPNTYGNATVQAGDDLGDLIFAGSDGTSLQFGAEILAEVQSGVGNDDLPTDLIFKTNGGTTNTTERVRIKSGGNVGIKTTAPNNTLTVGDNVQTSIAPSIAGNYIEIARTSGGDAGLLINKNTGQWLVGIDNSDGANAPLRFEYGAAGSAHPGFGAGTLGMIIKHGGNIGVGGTTIPRSKFDFGPGTGHGVLNQTLANYQATFESPQGTGNISRNIGFSVGTNGIGAAINAVDDGANDATGLLFATGTAGAIAERLHIDSNGNIINKSSFSSADISNGVTLNNLPGIGNGGRRIYRYSSSIIAAVNTYQAVFKISHSGSSSKVATFTIGGNTLNQASGGGNIGHSYTKFVYSVGNGSSRHLNVIETVVDAKNYRSGFCDPIISGNDVYIFVKSNTSSSSGRLDLQDIYIDVVTNDFSVYTIQSITGTPTDLGISDPDPVLTYKIHNDLETTGKIISDGNVGIGTDNPNFSSFGSNTGGLEISDVNTNNALLVQSGANEFYFANTSSANYIWGDDNVSLLIATNDTERLRITSGGQVNIGTNNLSQTTYKAQIETGTNRFLSFGTAAHNDFSDEGSGIFFSRPSDGSKIISGIFQHTNLSLGLATRGDLTLHAGGTSTYSASPERLRITSAGKVGINSTSPAVQLDIRSTDAIRVPVGTTGERPTGAAGYIRYNSTIASYEGHNGSEWAGIGGAAEVETTVSSTSATTCESFAKITYRSASIIAQITQGSNYQVGNYLLIHDGTTVTLIEESAVATGDMLGTFTATISGDNVVFQVNMASASSATVTTKMTKVSIP